MKMLLLFSNFLASFSLLPCLWEENNADLDLDLDVVSGEIHS